MLCEKTWALPMLSWQVRFCMWRNFRTTLSNLQILCLLNQLTTLIYEGNPNVGEDAIKKLSPKNCQWKVAIFCNFISVTIIVHIYRIHCDISLHVSNCTDQIRVFNIAPQSPFLVFVHKTYTSLLGTTVTPLCWVALKMYSFSLTLTWYLISRLSIQVLIITILCSDWGFVFKILHVLMGEWSSYGLFHLMRCPPLYYKWQDFML